jgi:hypothetical protein
MHGMDADVDRIGAKLKRLHGGDIALPLLCCQSSVSLQQTPRL